MLYDLVRTLSNPRTTKPPASSKGHRGLVEVEDSPSVGPPSGQASDRPGQSQTGAAGVTVPAKRTSVRGQLVPYSSDRDFGVG